jgi:hypothetical protein
MFHLIYPNQYIMRAGAIELLWVLLNSRFSISRLGSISRTYGGSTLKVEPRELDNLPVINPLALTEEIKRMILGWINNFYYHRETAVLMRQIDELVGNLLASETGQRTQSALPIQLRLLESIENNEDLFET